VSREVNRRQFVVHGAALASCHVAAGSADEERARGETLLWGEASDGAGFRVASRLRGPEGYTFTALAALACLRRVLAGRAPPGFQTPSRAFGADFVLGLPGVTRADLPAGAGGPGHR
jgi:short subunit dehydrogenase-like uncharacterized protein